MKITAKFSLAMAFIALISIIIFNVVAYKEIFDITDSSAENSISATSSAQAEMIGSFVNELQNNGKNIAINKDISIYTSIMSMSVYDRPYHPDYGNFENISSYAKNSVNSYQQSNPNVELAVILDKDGNDLRNKTVEENTEK